MSSFRTTSASLAVLASLATLHCSSAELGAASAGDGSALVDVSPTSFTDATPDVEDCRSLAGSRGVRLGPVSGSASCRFDTGALALDCQLSAGSSSKSTSSQYASVADFVEAGHTLGKITSLREVETTNAGERVTSHAYDELGRLARSTQTDASGSRVYRYGAYDDAGRPQRALPDAATLAGAPCDAPALAIDYDDALGRVVFHYQPGAECSEPDFRVLEQYDALGNLLRVERQSGDASETTFEASTAGEVQAICETP